MKNGLNKNKWKQAAGEVGVDFKGFSITTKKETAQARAWERNSKGVVIEANAAKLPLKKGSMGSWTDADELYIDVKDFSKVKGNIFDVPKD